MRDINVDVVMCIDGSAGMNPIIDEFKANASSLFDKVIDKIEETGTYISSFRIKVIVFRDYGCDVEPMVESQFYTLPDQNDNFRDFVNSIEAKGGGDCPENALEAIALALKSDWTTEGSKRRHIVFVFSDAPALPLGERSDSMNYPSGMPADLKQLEAWWHGMDPSFDSTYQLPAGRMVAFVPYDETWSQFEYWNRYYSVYVREGSGLSEIDFQSLIDLFGMRFEM